MGATFERQLDPDWDTIKGIWDLCLQFLLAQGLGQDVAYGLCMSTQELLENAVKYGDWSGPSKVDLAIRIGSREVTIEVKSPTSADAEHLRKFDESIQWIRGYQDPFEAYVERMKRVSSQAFVPGKSGLGLTRVAYEGQCILDFYVDDHSVLAVSAVYHR